MSDALQAREERIHALGYDPAAQPRVYSASCNLCGADNWVTLVHHDRYGYASPATACRTCGLTVLNPAMDRDGYGAFYESIYRPLVSAYHGRVIDAKSVQDDQVRYSEELQRLVAPYLMGRTGQRFLDVGGSSGIVALHFAREFGVKPVVLDPAPDEIAESQALGLETITAFIEDWKPEGHYEVVGMFQTIDHLLDVRATLDKLRQAIHPEGVFIVDIVDFRAAVLKNSSVEGAVKVDHPYSLTEEVTEAYLARSGFRILRRAYSDDKHLVAYVCAPCDPDPDALPDSGWVRRWFEELRYVQNARELKG